MYTAEVRKQIARLLPNGTLRFEFSDRTDLFVGLTHPVSTGLDDQRAVRFVERMWRAIDSRSPDRSLLLGCKGSARLPRDVRASR